MNLCKLIASISVKEMVGKEDVRISGIQSDSRKIEKNALFVAIKGTTDDGHDYIENAIAKGASAIVCEYIPLKPEQRSVPFVIVKDSSETLGLLLNSWYDYPSSKLILVGVTGTNGKTTIATLLYKLFNNLGHKAGLMSTVCNYIYDEKIPAIHTTPDPVALYNLLARMVDAGCEYAFMEVSSHAIDQKRISGLNFKGGIFTNLTRDHLDYHKTVAHYLKTKKKFFDN
jgi:UDP-N-acetylmuramoyl-L-alanyl-D-glutamate--2,6-diaminopimelate ligase